jgi:hypothetical protein
VVAESIVLANSFFQASFERLDVLNKDLKVWLDGA